MSKIFARNVQYPPGLLQPPVESAEAALNVHRSDGKVCQIPRTRDVEEEVTLT